VCVVFFFAFSFYSIKSFKRVDEQTFDTFEDILLYSALRTLLFSFRLSALSLLSGACPPQPPQPTLTSTISPMPQIYLLTHLTKFVYAVFECGRDFQGASALPYNSPYLREPLELNYMPQYGVCAAQGTRTSETVDQMHLYSSTSVLYS
jgi:hypothetical protein